MNNPRRKAKRIIRELTPAESKRLAQARSDAEANREEILRAGRIAKQAWLAMRREVEETVKKLRDERERLGLSLADVEERAGIRRSVLSRLENDQTTNPTMLTLQRYASALGLTLHTVLKTNRK